MDLIIKNKHLSWKNNLQQLISDGIKQYRRKLPDNFGFRTDVNSDITDTGYEFIIQKGVSNKKALDTKSLKNV